MACGYFKAGVTDHDAAFHVTFRENPFAGQFTVACGLATAIDFLRAFHFTDTEVDYLGSQRGNDGKPLFDSRFLDYVRGLQLTCDVDAMPEGTLVFPNEPLIRVRWSDHSMSATRDRPAQYFQFPKPDCYEGGARLPGC